MKRLKINFNTRSLSWFTLKIVTWLTAAFKLELVRPLKDFLGLVRTLEKIEESNGQVYLIKYCKNARLALSRHLSGQPFKSKDLEGIRLTSDGIPIILDPWIHLIRSQVSITSDLQLIMTILSMTRALNLGKEPDFKPIESASDYTLPADIEAKIFLFWKELGYNRMTKSVPKRALWTQYHPTSKVSPYLRDGLTDFHKKNALWHSISDLMCLPLDLIESIKIVGGKTLTERIDTLKKAVEEPLGIDKWLWLQPSNNFRKLSYFPDKELKVRVVAIGDYFSQTALRPLHLFLFRILRRIPQDMTFNQGAFKGKVNEYKIHYSLDLTAATDRFPIELIELVLRGRFPWEYTKAWKNIMVGYPFRVPQEEKYKFLFDVKPNEERWISYSVGNPMGFYSSWSSFALAHHFVIFYCCQKLKMDWKTAPYHLLGDDVVIHDEGLALCYKEMIKDLGIQISEPKSFISPHFFEFAKRIFYKGEEITPFPISAMRESLQNLTNFVGLLLETENKGWFPKSTPSEAISLAYGTILSYRSKYKSKLEAKAYVIDRILRSIRGTLPAGQAVEACLSKLGFALGPISDKVGNSLLENIVVDLFSQQPEMQPINKEEPCSFELVANLVMELTGVDEELLPLGLESIMAIPTIQIQGQIEEVYMTLTRKAREISISGGDWGLLFRSLALPQSDRIFSERSAKSISRVSGKVAGLLKERGQILVQFPQMLREKSTLSSSHIKVPINVPSNPYLDYKIRLVSEFLTFILKFLLGILAGIAGVSLGMYYIDTVSQISVLGEIQVPEIGPLPITGEADTLTSSVSESWIDDPIWTSILVVEGIAILGFAVIISPGITPVVPLVISQIFIEYFPLYHMGIFS